ncbi:DUF2092 domain-containing protein [bacterium]|nr:DUF2092 domain-containing protein [bacterium]MCI0618784.1 DUF2092 domain-containing protein [bacterium]
MRKIFICFVLFIAVLSFAFSQTANADSGEEIIKKMSDKLSSAKTFSFSTSEVHTKVKLSGKKTDVKLAREALVRRPNGFRYSFQGGREWDIWYDGKFLTAVSDKEKGFIQASMPPTIDETLDEIADRFDINMPVSDLMYSSPYDSFTGSNSKGGVVGTQSVEGKLCDHLVYKSDAVDWELWVGKNDSLPYQLILNYKDDPRNPTQQIIFKNWNLNAQATDKDFAFNIPQGYQRIPIMEKIRVVESSQTQTKPK